MDSSDEEWNALEAPYQAPEVVEEAEATEVAGLNITQLHLEDTGLDAEMDVGGLVRKAFGPEICSPRQLTFEMVFLAGRKEKVPGLVDAGAKMMELEFLGMNFTCMVDSLQRYELPSSHDCLFPLLSKILGYIIVAGASIVKLPQIILIIKNKSIKGLSLTSFELEVVGFTIALAYCLWKQLPFSAYGELVFLLLQGIIILALIYYYSWNLGPLTWLKAGVYCAITPQLLAGNINAALFEALYGSVAARDFCLIITLVEASQYAVLIFARVPQLFQNYKTKNTGQLSFLTSFLSFGGGAVRLLTLVQEGAPGLMLLGSFLGFVTNGIIVSQIVYYSTKGSPKKDKAKAS